MAGPHPGAVPRHLSPRRGEASLLRDARLAGALGEVTLGGFVSAEAVTPDIVKVAAGVSGVRVVNARMEVEEAASPGLTPAAPSAPAPPPEPAAAAQEGPEA